ncbi:MAG: bifunctional aspartate kinase/homoserine dehydrogenase I [Ignavibacteria bacterium]|nr:bifunctional aspartate kinase/homoserine dehydrogenase I [Ignavibacteria bacterium]
MKVLKFGGSSVGKPKVIRQTASIIQESSGARAVVLSAYQGITDKLILMAKLAGARDRKYEDVFNTIAEIHYTYLDELISDFASAEYKQTRLAIHEMLQEMKEIVYGIYLVKELSLKSLDFVMSYGERLSCTTVAAYLRYIGVPAEYLDARNIIKTTAEFNSAKVLFADTNKLIKEYFSLHSDLQVVTGFVGSTVEFETTTLGRGGSDFTASILGAGLHADEIEIWTDVDGVLTSDPRCVPDAFVVDNLSYVEAMELSYFGAKVIYAPTIQPAYENSIPIRIKNTFNPSHPGSVIGSKTANTKYGITGIASVDDIAVLRVEGSGMVGIPGIVARIFRTLSEQKISLILITQASSEHTICFAVKKSLAFAAKRILEKEFELEIGGRLINQVHIDQDLAIVSVVGENMRHRTGVCGKIFGALGKYHINIIAIAQGSSELNVSFVIEQKDLIRALNVIHDEFFFNYLRKANLYIIGATGNVGNNLLKIIRKFQQDDIEIVVAGIANSKNMIVDYQGVTAEMLDNGQPLNLDAFIAQAEADRHPMKIVVDCTASDSVSTKYVSILSKGLHLVVANKIANSIDMHTYKAIRASAKEANVKFKYETNVGASLPVVKTLQQFVKSKDYVKKIEALLSGSVNFILTRVHDGVSFKDAVEEAKNLGYTEPNPNVDLSGLDVARKILILSREMGYELNLGDVEISSLIHGNPLHVDLSKCDLRDIDTLVSEARKEGKKVKLIAGFEDGQAWVRLMAIDNSHPLYIIDGANNAIRFFTRRYSKYPLVISGQGAGGELTASGVLEDILSIIN